MEWYYTVVITSVATTFFYILLSLALVFYVMPKVLPFIIRRRIEWKMKKAMKDVQKNKTTIIATTDETQCTGNSFTCPVTGHTHWPSDAA